jgi:hypothetical protein
MTFDWWNIIIAVNIICSSSDRNLLNYQSKFLYIKFEVSMAASIHIVVFWVMTPFSLVGGYQHFGGAQLLLFLMLKHGLQT